MTDPRIIDLQAPILLLAQEMVGKTIKSHMKHVMGQRTEVINEQDKPTPSPSILLKLEEDSTIYVRVILHELRTQGWPEVDELEAISQARKPIGGFSAISQVTRILNWSTDEYQACDQLSFELDAKLSAFYEQALLPPSSSTPRELMEAIGLPPETWFIPVCDDPNGLTGHLLELPKEMPAQTRKAFIALADNLYLSWLAKWDVAFSDERIESVSALPWLTYVMPKSKQKGGYKTPNARLIDICSCFAHKVHNNAWPEKPLTTKEILQLKGFYGDWLSCNKAEPVADQDREKQDIDPRKRISHWREGRKITALNFTDLWEALCNKRIHAPWPVYLGALFWKHTLTRQRLQQQPDLLEKVETRYMYWWRHHLKKVQAEKVGKPDTPQPAFLSKI
jgi:hypothetical protein